MNENLSELLRRWRATGNALIENNPAGSEGEVTGRRYLAFAAEVESAQKNHPYAAASLAALLAGSLVVGEVGLEFQVRQHESDSAVYSLAAPWREFPAIPTEHVPGLEPGEDNAPTTISVSASGSPSVSATIIGTTARTPDWTKVRAFTELLEPLRPLRKPPNDAGKK